MLAAAEFAKEHGPNAAVVLGADLNSIPGSGVYSLLTTGVYPPTTLTCASSRRASSSRALATTTAAAALRSPAAPSLVSVCDGARARASLHQLHGPASPFVGTLDYLMCNGELHATHALLAFGGHVPRGWVPA